LKSLESNMHLHWQSNRGRTSGG